MWVALGVEVLWMGLYRCLCCGMDVVKLMLFLIFDCLLCVICDRLLFFRWFSLSTRGSEWTSVLCLFIV